MSEGGKEGIKGREGEKEGLRLPGNYCKPPKFHYCKPPKFRDPLCSI